jgi:hypothetical protein
MFNFLKSAFTRTSDDTVAEELVEELARQHVRSYPFDLKNFTAGVKFQKADAQAQRDIVVALLAWLHRHPLTGYPRTQEEQKAWQVGWQMREALLQMLKRRLPFTEHDVITMLDWSASQTSGPLHSSLSGIPQMIKSWEIISNTTP